jgi:hypothetical protein
VSKFITILERTLEQTETIVKKSSKESEVASKQVFKEEVVSNIKKKYVQIKERNLQILRAMLDLRKKLMNTMYMHKVSLPDTELEMQLITEKIGLVSANIRQKLDQYNFSKQINSLSLKMTLKVDSVNAPLVELIAASEKICKETIRLRQ